jgi:ketosteroid isomerase-like protein
MAGSADVHVTPHGDGWAVQREGTQRAASVHSTQAEAEQAGREMARRDQVEFFLHGRDGQIRARDSYGNDPRHRPG